MKRSINLHFGSVHRGPGRVVQNLAIGLKNLGFEIFANDVPRFDVYQGCLQPTQAIYSLTKNALMGPNLFVLPSEWGDLCQRFNHYVVPSEWVKSKYAEFSNLSHASIHVWPVGIDVNVWRKESSKETGSVLVYFKNRDEVDLNQICENLKSLSIDFTVLRYGSYDEKDLFDACNFCDSCILLTGTESQGIAYMQILSMGIPCFVVNQPVWNNEGKWKSVPATSAPYFSENCGILCERFDENRFSLFLKEKEKYLPRDYILNNHTLEISAKKYIEILEMSHGK